MLPLQAQEAVLLNEVLKSPGVTVDEVKRWQMYRFFEGKFLPETGGLNDQYYNEIMGLKKLSFIYAIIELVLEIRDDRARQYNEFEKLAQELSAVA